MDIKYDVDIENPSYDLMGKGRYIELPKDIADYLCSIIKDAKDEITKNNPYNISFVPDENGRQEYSILSQFYGLDNRLFIYAKVLTIQNTDKETLFHFGS